MRASSRPQGRIAIASHPIFKPALIGWAGLIGALTILILPEQLIARLSLVTGLSILGDNARYVLAILGGVIGGGCGFGIAALFQSATARKTADGADEPHAETEFAIDEEGEIRPIDPAAELGSDSLDTPIESAQFEEIAETTAPISEPESNAELIEEANPAEGRRRTLAQIAQQDQVSEGSETASPADNADQDPIESILETDLEAEDNETADAQRETDEHAFSQPPQSFDLDEFAALPGRNAVWVEDLAPQTEAETDPEPEQGSGQSIEPGNAAGPARAEVTTALARLRAKPIDELSMMQMIERLAAALEDRKSALQSNPTSLNDPARKQDLADGLKTLSVMANDETPEVAPLDTDSYSDCDVEQENAKLRDALDKLADLRGAA